MLRKGRKRSTSVYEAGCSGRARSPSLWQTSGIKQAWAASNETKRHDSALPRASPSDSSARLSSGDGPTSIAREPCG